MRVLFISPLAAFVLLVGWLLLGSPSMECAGLADGRFILVFGVVAYFAYLALFWLVDRL